jgi:CRISPR-associated protein Cas2
MIVMILEKVPTRLRGEMTRWLLEPHSGVFIGHLSAMVRDHLWEKCCKAHGGAGGVLQIWSTNTEQRFIMRMHGQTKRRVINFEGMQLISITEKTEVEGTT